MLKYSFLVSKICHSPGMPVCSEEDPMPEVDFDYCAPNVLLSEIKTVYFAKTNASPFNDWSNADEWNGRLSETSMDIDAIRPLTCIADKPAPSVIRRNLSNERRKITARTHVINVTIDEVSAANHEFVRSLKKGKQLRVWYDTLGSLLFGGNSGILATVFGEMVLARGTGEIMTYQIEIIWHVLELEPYIVSPIVDRTPGSPLLNDNYTPLLNDDGTPLLNDN